MKLMTDDFEALELTRVMIFPHGPAEFGGREQDLMNNLGMPRHWLGRA